MEMLKTLDSNQNGLYLLQLPPEYLQETNSTETFAIPIMTRSGGVLLAVPLGYIQEVFLTQGETAAPDALIGPSRILSVLGVEEEEDGTEVPTGQEMQLVVVDCHILVIGFLKEFNPASDSPPSRCFLEGFPQVLPLSSSLLSQTLEWVTGNPEDVPDRVQYYSAAEEENMPQPRAKSAAKATPKPKTSAPSPLPKKVTTAVLAEHFNEMAAVLPVISAQLQELKERQVRFEQNLNVAQSPKPPPYRSPFQTPPPTKQDVASFVSGLGQPPRARSSISVPAKPMTPLVEDEPQLIPSEDGYLQNLGQQPAGLSQALFTQSQALTTLVAHLVNQDSLGDLTAASSSSLSTKGSAKREKLQQELASRSGNFFLQVSQNAFRRLKPSEEIPKTLAAFGGKSVFSKYFEKQGGFAGQKDLGLVAWLLAQMADLMVHEDFVGASEMMALILVAVEQAAQDGGRWELAWLLALQEEPPPSIFQPRPTQTNPRVRAFAPLCPPIWTTTALSYVKELDIFTNRRLEAVPAKKTGEKWWEKEKGKEKEDGNTSKKKPRYPKKPKSDAQAETG